MSAASAGQRREHVARVELAIVDRGAIEQRAAKAEGGREIDRGEQFAEVAWRWEVLVLVGDLDFFDTVAAARGGR